jgi:hypothetical protein
MYVLTVFPSTPTCRAMALTDRPDELPNFDHRVLPPASRRSSAISARPPTIPRAPGMVGSPENWGNFKFHKCGELLRHSQMGRPTRRKELRATRTPQAERPSRKRELSICSGRTRVCAQTLGMPTGSLKARGPWVDPAADEVISPAIKGFGSVLGPASIRPRAKYGGSAR